ncbi:MAG: hypothetical protein MjAS7_0082 [Metallosphaera javensis (ex Sakai et al. 2022)]|nr:MAG: hypothetical protein MjAS7_0082 [Metallosphaera javensis (ex Sakai et al. 2022)]
MAIRNIEMSRIIKRISRLPLNFSNIDVIILLTIVNFFLTLDFTRLGNLYGTDATIFPYYNSIVAQKYYYSMIMGYCPWMNSISGYTLGVFLEYFLVYMTSNVPYSEILFLLILYDLSSFFVYLFVRDVLMEIDTSYKVYIVSMISGIFYILSPNIGNNLYTDPLTTIYINAYLPVIVYFLRKYIVINNLYQSLIYFFILIPFMYILYIFIDPIYFLAGIIFLGSFFFL